MTNTIWVSASAARGGNGSAESPFATIQQAIDAAAPGTTINVKAGIYLENLKFDESGTAGAPIKLVSIDGQGAAVIKPASPALDTINIDGADYIQISDFEIHGSGDSSRQAIHVHVRDYRDPASHIVIDGNTIYRGAGDGIKGSKSEYLTITDNTIIGGGTAESSIDFVGVNHAVIDGNVIKDTGNIGIMVKGGSDDVKITGNLIDGVRASGIEVGGYSTLTSYWSDFIAEGNTYEARNVVVSGNKITDVEGTALRLIGAQEVTVSGNEIDRSAKIISVDDSAKYHEVWYSQDIRIEGNSFDQANWLVDRSNGEGLVSLNNVTDGRDIVNEVAIADQNTSAPEPSSPIPPPHTAAPSPSPSPSPAPTPEPTTGLNKIVGTSKSETVNGTTAADSIEGGSGADKLFGYAGDDDMFGGAGKDRLYGGVGTDRLTGGADADRFYFHGIEEVGVGAGKRDIITDFQAGQDDIVIEKFGGVAFKFVAEEGANFTGRKGEIIWDNVDTAGTSNDRTMVSVDLNGDRTVDFEIELVGLVNLKANDFDF